jgi:phosphoethanolamine N-methyltransferase
MRTQYPDDFVATLECMWGEGFLSPGGAQEVRTLLKGTDLAGRRVLDVGSGLGAVALLLISEHGAREVVGIDVEPRLLDRATAAAEKAGLSERARFLRVEPGPFPFPDGSFDVVFSKDAMVHIPDKPALYADVLRVLRPGGLFAASDWLYGGGRELSAPMRAWLEIVHLDFAMEGPEESAEAMRKVGFIEVTVRDRNAWYREEIRREIESIAEDFEGLVAAVGREAAEHRLESSKTKKIVVDRGELKPCHLRGRRPG